jgi:hypothetical protein
MELAAYDLKWGGGGKKQNRNKQKQICDHLKREKELRSQFVC